MDVFDSYGDSWLSGWAHRGHEKHLMLRDLMYLNDPENSLRHQVALEMHIFSQVFPRGWLCQTAAVILSTVCIMSLIVAVHTVLLSCNTVTSCFGHSCCTWKAINTWQWTSAYLHCWRRMPWEWHWTQQEMRDPGFTSSPSTSCGPWETVWVEWSVGFNLIILHFF